MGHVVVSFFVGLLFAVGLGISGMTIPEKVIGFLDVTGGWDASLLFVMGGATTTYFLFYRIVRGSAPIFGADFRIPTRRQIDKRLLGGATLFGIGWGLAGICPGPALTSLPILSADILIFVASMVAGMYAFTAFERLRKRTTTSESRAQATSMRPWQEAN